MRKKAYLLPLLLLALVGGAALLYFPVRSYLIAVKAKVAEGIGQALQSSVTLEFGRIRIAVRHGIGLRLYDIAIREKEGERREISSAQSVFVGLDPRSLWRGEVRILKIAAYRPRMIFIRDASGKLNVEGLFEPRFVKENLPAGMADSTLGQTFGPFLWRNQVSLEEGEILYRDDAREGSAVLRIINLDLDVRNHLESDYLRVEVSGEVKAPIDSGTFSLQGEVKGWKSAHQISELSTSVSLSFQGVDLNGIGAHLPGLTPKDRIQGVVSGNASYEGLLLLPGKGRVQVEVADAFFQSDRVHPRPFGPQRLGLAAGVSGDRDRFTFAEGVIDLNGLRIQCSGDLRFEEGRVSLLNLDLQGTDLSLVDAKQYIPLRLVHGKAWPFLVDMATGGRIDVRARLRGAPADFSRMDTLRGEGALYLWIRFRETTVVLPVEEPYLPFHSVNGILELDSGTIFFRDFEAGYGETSIPDIRGTILGIHQPQSHLQVRARARLDMPETVSQLDHGIFPDGLREIARDLSSVSGRGSLAIQLDFPFGKGADEVLRVAGEAILSDVACNYAGFRLGLKAVTGTLAFSESSLSAIDMRLHLGDSPIRVTGQVLFGNEQKAAQGKLLLAGETLKAGDLLTLLGRQDAVTALLSGKAAINWQGGAVDWTGELQGDSLELTTRNYLLSGRSFRVEAEGRNGLLFLRNLGVTLEGNTFSASGQWQSLHPVVGRIDIQSPALNLNSLLARKRTLQPWEKLLGGGGESTTDPERYRGVDVQIGLRCDQFAVKAVALEDLGIRGHLQAGTLTLEQANALAGEGRIALQGQCDLKAGSLPFSFLYSLSRVNAQDFFRWFSIKKDFLEGPLFLEGNLKGEIRPAGSFLHGLEGRTSLLGCPCTLQRYEILSKLLTLVNFTQWTRIKLSDLSSRGVACREIKGNFNLQGGYLTTDQLLIDSSVALAEVAGRYDFVHDHLGLDLVLKPTEPLDQVLDKIPVVGYVIPGPDGKVVVFNYRIEGPLGNPDVRLVPLRGIGERINDPLRKLNGLLRSVKDRVIPQPVGR